jgi:hypothetical protein
MDEINDGDQLQANHDAGVNKLIALGLTWDEVAALFGLPPDAEPK